MTSTTTCLTPPQVSGLSDNELSEAVARAIGLPVGETRLWEGKPARPVPCVVTFWPTHLGYYGSEVLEAFQWSPQSPAAVLHVMEHMRQHWAKSGEAKGWSLNDLWAEEDEPPLWWASVVSMEGSTPAVTAATLGRAVFEAALLSMQEERT